MLRGLGQRQVTPIFLELLHKLSNYLKTKVKDSKTLSFYVVATCHRKTQETVGNHAF